MKGKRERDPMELIVQEALGAAGIPYISGDDPRSPARLDFYLPGRDVHIEVKRLHTDRIARQMARADNVIVAQGSEAVKLLAAMLRGGDA